MNLVRRAVAICLVLLLAEFPVASQENVLRLGSQIEARLAAGQIHTYQMTLPELTLLSLRAEALDEELDPVITVYDSAGARLVSNDDYAYPESRDALIQALMIPRLDNYSIEISGFAESSGAYRLSVLPGFAQLASLEDALSPTGWEALYDVASIIQSAQGQLSVNLEGLAQTASIVARHVPQEPDYYFEIQFEQISATASDAQVGIIYRYQRPDMYSRLLLNQRGFWRIERVDEGEVVVVRDWSTHPAIRPEESDFRLGLLVSGQHIDVLYNGQIVGTVADPDLAESGGVGIALRSADAVGSRLTFSVSDVTLTVPTRLDGRLVFPKQIVARNRPALADALTRQQLVPVGSEVRLTLPQSSVRHSAAGVTRFLLGGGIQFAEFALGAELTMQLNEPANGGCGLVFHYVDELRYSVAYLTSTGEFGVSQRNENGFKPGIYGELGNGDLEGREMLVIAQGAALHYFLDGAHVGSMPYQPVSGRVGIAVVNYAEVATNCMFEDLWLLSSDN